jgi:membrane-associated protease RseP (regulator of RpoE activity)
MASVRRLAWPLVLAASSACAAVYPEVGTPINSAPPGVALQPPPPEDVLYLQFASAEIPTKTRDGRRWDSVGGEAPDTFAKLIVDSKVLIETPVESNTLRPTWPDQTRANYRIRSGAAVKIELWDSNPMVNHPVCSETIFSLHDGAQEGRAMEIDCDSGARIRLQVEPARAKLGIGMFYELKSGAGAVTITRVLAESPAARAGLRRGYEIVKIQGEDVKNMDTDRAQSLINANASVGVKLEIRRDAGGNQLVTVKNGPIYPLKEEEVALDQ